MKRILCPQDWQRHAMGNVMVRIFDVWIGKIMTKYRKIY